ncbi:MAG: hypothetical protein LBV03_06395 [Fusobacteriales bacterium]|jgi:hypothetical protein|nr:hypothetical protein [Fusobacteriales bacterium]
MDEVSDSESYSYIFTYKGVKYKLDKKQDKIPNSEFVSLRNSSLNDNSFYYELQQTIPNLCTVIKEDGSLELYDSIEEILNLSEISFNENHNPVSLRASTSNNTYAFRLIAYEKEFLLSKMADHYPTLKHHYTYPFMAQYTASFRSKMNSFYLDHFEPLTSGGTWPQQTILYLVFFASSDHTGQTLVYNLPKAKIQNSPPPLTELQLSNIGWENKIQSFLFMMTWFQ